MDYWDGNTCTHLNWTATRVCMHIIISPES